MFSRQSQVRSAISLSWTRTMSALSGNVFIFLQFTVSRWRKWVHFLKAQTTSNRDLRKLKLSHHKLIMSLFTFHCSALFFPSLPAEELQVDALTAALKALDSNRSVHLIFYHRDQIKETIE